jgi:hypothetical protein
MRPLSPPRTVLNPGATIAIAPVRMLAMNSVRDTWADGINGIELLCVLSQTYEDFALVPPEEYDYAKHVGPWCRYCGARYVSAQGGGTASGQCITSACCSASSGWGRGPWGLRTLCQPHNLQKQHLMLEQWPEEPVHPINSSDNSEIKYLDYCRKVGSGVHLCVISRCR